MEDLQLLLSSFQVLLNLTEFFHNINTTCLQTINAVENVRTRRSQEFNPVIKIGHTIVHLLPVQGIFLLMLRILVFLDYELPILNESNLEHLRLEVFGQLALNLLEKTLNGSASCTSWPMS
jgi:hypothetical protein